MTTIGQTGPTGPTGPIRRRHRRPRDLPDAPDPTPSETPDEPAAALPDEIPDEIPETTPEWAVDEPQLTREEAAAEVARLLAMSELDHDDPQTEQLLEQGREARRQRAAEAAERDAAARAAQDRWERTCRTCSVICPTPTITCETCALASQRRRWLGELHERWTTCATALPSWPWARWDHAAWATRVDPRIVGAIEGTDGTTSLVLLGPTGAGKTSSLVAQLHRLRAGAEAAVAARTELHRGSPDDQPPCPLVDYAWTTEAQLVAARRGHRLGAGEAPLVERAMSAPLLVLDEITGSAPALVMEIADARYAAQLPTWSTAGMPARQLATRVGAACLRRLVEGGRVVDLHDGAGR